MRLNKAVAHRSKFSRREAEKLIADGKVKVNKKIILDPAMNVEEEDIISVRDHIVESKKGKYTVIIYSKDKGELVTKKDERGRRTIYHSLPNGFKHYVPVGRLDYASEGLLILTDAKDIAETLMTSSLPRSYNLKIAGKVTKEMVTAMEEGIYIDDARKGGHERSNIVSMEVKPFINFKVLKDHPKYTRIRVTINEGKNRELRRFFAYFNAEVLDLKRVSFGPFELNRLPGKKFRFLSTEEYDVLRELIKEIRSGETKDKKRV